MKLHPATLLILIMFGSFAVILTAMILMFRPEPKPVRPKRVEKQAPQRHETIDTMLTTRPDSSPRPEKQETKPSPAASFKPEPPLVQRPSQSGRKLYRELEREQKEMAQLRADMERRLNTALADHNRKLAQLARRCEPLEPGEAVQVLMPLSDTDIANVISRMRPDKAAPIIALLKRNGREKAVAKIK